MILLRPYSLPDIQPLFDAIIESRVHIAQWLPWCHAAYSIDDTRAWVTRQVHAFAAGEEYAFAICDSSGRLVGGCGLNHIDRADRCANIGYWVRSSCIGHGVATAATKELVTWVFRNTDFVRLEVLVAVENIPSQRVTEKAGAVREGVLRSRIFINGRSHDCVVYSFVRGDSA